MFAGKQKMFSGIPGINPIMLSFLVIIRQMSASWHCVIMASFFESRISFSNLTSMYIRFRPFNIISIFLQRHFFLL